MKLKKIAACLTAISLAVFQVFRYDSSETFHPVTVVALEAHSLGDVNGDKMVDGKDASRVLAEYSSLSSGGASTLSSIEFSAADVDNDGSVSAMDASYILKYYSYNSTGGNKDIKSFLHDENETESSTTLPVTTTTNESTQIPTTTAKVTSPSGVRIITDDLSVPVAKVEIQSESSLFISWDAVENAKSYCVEFSPKSDFSFINRSINTPLYNYKILNYLHLHFYQTTNNLNRYQNHLLKMYFLYYQL